MANFWWNYATAGEFRIPNLKPGCQMDALAQTPILVDQVYESLISAIAEQRLQPGERLRQGKLAATLGVSRQPVSHALQLLKHQGLLRESGRQGLEVVPLEPQRILHLYQARASLDALAASLAAARAAAGELSERDRDDLADVAAGHSAFDRALSPGELCQADIAFHQAIYQMSGNPVIFELLAPQWAHLRRSMTVMLEDRNHCVRAGLEHGLLARLIRAGDADGAAAAAFQHASHFGQETARRLSEAYRLPYEGPVPFEDSVPCEGSVPCEAPVPCEGRLPYMGATH